MELPTKESLTIEFKSDRKRLPDSELVDAVVGMRTPKAAHSI